MKAGEIVNIYRDYKGQEQFVGTAVLLLRDKRKDGLTFSDPKEDDEKRKHNTYAVENSPISGEYDGKKYSIKIKSKKYNLYSSEYWLVSFISSEYYGKEFRKWFHIRTLKGSSSTLKGLSELTTYSSKFDEKDVEEIEYDISNK